VSRRSPQFMSRTVATESSQASLLETLKPHQCCLNCRYSASLCCPRRAPVRVPRQPEPDAELSLCQSPVSCGFRAHSRQRRFAKDSRNLCLIFNYENTQRAAFLNITGLGFTSVALPNGSSVNGFYVSGEAVRSYRATRLSSAQTESVGTESA
jgi:hypothetical protein